MHLPLPPIFITFIQHCYPVTSIEAQFIMILSSERKHCLHHFILIQKGRSLRKFQIACNSKLLCTIIYSARFYYNFLVRVRAMPLFHSIRGETKTSCNSLTRFFPPSHQLQLLNAWSFDWFNRPFPSGLLPLFCNKSSCKTFFMKMSLICMNGQMKCIFIIMVNCVKTRFKGSVLAIMLPAPLLLFWLS